MMKVRGSIAPQEPHALLVECGRGAAALQVYRKAMEHLVTSDVREVVARQFMV